MLIKWIFVGAAVLASANAYAVGALAVDGKPGGRFGFSRGYGSESDASKRALSECGSGCSVVGVFPSGCAAYAADKSPGGTANGMGTGSSRSQAQSSALQNCKSNGGSQCAVRVWACEDPPQSTQERQP